MPLDDDDDQVDDADVSAFDDGWRACEADESNRRRWLRGLVEFVKSRPSDGDVDDQVKAASDIALIAAFGAIRRIAGDVAPCEDLDDDE